MTRLCFAALAVLSFGGAVLCVVQFVAGHFSAWVAFPAFALCTAALASCANAAFRADDQDPGPPGVGDDNEAAADYFEWRDQEDEQ